MFAYPDSAISFIQTHFLLALPVSWGYQTQREYYTRLTESYTFLKCINADAKFMDTMLNICSKQKEVNEAVLQGG
jgi:hypothetical protein